MSVATATKATPSPACSRPEQIAALKVGDTFSISRRLDQDSATREAIAEAQDQLRGTLQAAAARARATTDGTYLVEGGDFRTRSYDLIITVAVTRMA